MVSQLRFNGIFSYFNIQQNDSGLTKRCKLFSGIAVKFTVLGFDAANYVLASAFSMTFGKGKWKKTTTINLYSTCYALNHPYASVLKHSSDKRTTQSKRDDGRTLLPTLWEYKGTIFCVSLATAAVACWYFNLSSFDSLTSLNNPFSNSTEGSSSQNGILDTVLPKTRQFLENKETQKTLNSIEIKKPSNSTDVKKYFTSKHFFEYLNRRFKSPSIKGREITSKQPWPFPGFCKFLPPNQNSLWIVNFFQELPFKKMPAFPNKIKIGRFSQFKNPLKNLLNTNKISEHWNWKTAAMATISTAVVGKFLLSCCKSTSKDLGSKASKGDCNQLEEKVLNFFNVLSAIPARKSTTS